MQCGRVAACLDLLRPCLALIFGSYFCQTPYYCSTCPLQFLFVFRCVLSPFCMLGKFPVDISLSYSARMLPAGSLAILCVPRRQWPSRQGGAFAYIHAGMHYLDVIDVRMYSQSGSKATGVFLTCLLAQAKLIAKSKQSCVTASTMHPTC